MSNADETLKNDLLTIWRHLERHPLKEGMYITGYAVSVWDSVNEKPRGFTFWHPDLNPITQAAKWLREQGEI